MEAFVTVATTDGYSIGALVLAHSLKSQATTKKLCILITPTVSHPIREALKGVFDEVVVVDVLDSQDSSHLALLKRPELGVTFTKLHCWTLTQYSKCVFLDADTLALKNIDDLFNHPELTATSDIGWPDCFNSGMFVFVPSQDTYNRLLEFAKEEGSFDGGDQGLLNTFFPDWNRVSFTYNMVASATYTYLPAFKRFGKDVKLVHFLGSTKPWHGESQQSHNATYNGFIHAWWAIYKELVAPSLPHESGASQHQGSGSSASSFQHYVPQEHAAYQLAQRMEDVSIHESVEESRRRWENGSPDYMGRDSFDNILSYIKKSVKDE